MLSLDGPEGYVYLIQELWLLRYFLIVKRRSIADMTPLITSIWQLKTMESTRVVGWRKYNQNVINNNEHFVPTFKRPRSNRTIDTIVLFAL